MGNLFTLSGISSLRHVEFCTRQKPDFVSSVCSRIGKSDCRQKAKGVPGQPGMDAASSSVSGITKRSWLFRNLGSLCNTCEPSCSCVCQLETRTWAVATDPFNVNLDFQLAYLFPPFCIIKRCLRKIQQDQSHCVLITPVRGKADTGIQSFWHCWQGNHCFFQDNWIFWGFQAPKRYTPCAFKKLQAGCVAHFRENSQRKDFLKKFQISSSLPGERKLPVSMKVPRRHGVAGVLSRRLIHLL